MQQHICFFNTFIFATPLQYDTTISKKHNMMYNKLYNLFMLTINEIGIKIKLK